MSSSRTSGIPWFASPYRMRRHLVVSRARALSVLLGMLLLGSASSAAQTADPGVPPIAGVVREMPRDLWRFISWDTATVLGIGGTGALVGHVWDDDLAGEIETNVRLNDAMQPGHAYGAFGLQAL